MGAHQVNKAHINSYTAVWATGDWSSSGKAHLWIESPFNPKYARSACGIVAAVVSFQAPAESTGKCKQCVKSEKLRSSTTATLEGTK